MRLFRALVVYCLVIYCNRGSFSLCVIEVQIFLIILTNETFISCYLDAEKRKHINAFLATMKGADYEGSNI